MEAELDMDPFLEARRGREIPSRNAFRDAKSAPFPYG
jgi:hypothetical protein